MWGRNQNQVMISIFYPNLLNNSLLSSFQGRLIHKSLINEKREAPSIDFLTCHETRLLRFSTMTRYSVLRGGPYFSEYDIPELRSPPPRPPPPPPLLPDDSYRELPRSEKPRPPPPNPPLPRPREGPRAYSTCTRSLSSSLPFSS